MRLIGVGSALVFILSSQAQQFIDEKIHADRNFAGGRADARPKRVDISEAAPSLIEMALGLEIRSGYSSFALLSDRTAWAWRGAAGLRELGVRESQEGCLTIYMTGDYTAPSPVEHEAQATVNLIFARIGMCLIWRDGEPSTSVQLANPLSIQARLSRGASHAAHADALAYALPFGNGQISVTILYDRVRWTAGRVSREPILLAYVLSHEIGHILQRTNNHAPTGIMKAHWDRDDLDAMERKRLWFTSEDVTLMMQGVNALRAGTVNTKPEHH
jgi:hypothetical protein